jgi:hypothetical protein
MNRVATLKATHTADSLALEYMVQRLMGKGFSRVDVQASLDATGQVELAAYQNLLEMLWDVEAGGAAAADAAKGTSLEDVQTMQDEEIEALDAILGPQCKHKKSGDALVVSLQLAKIKGMKGGVRCLHASPSPP